MTGEAKHVHGRRLGLLPPDLNRPLIRFAQVRTGAVPAHPLFADHYTGATYGLYQNDNLGDCGPTMIANMRRAITAILGGREADPTDADVLDLYARSTNPPFNPVTKANDNGVVLADLLSACVKTGIAGVKALAYAAVDVKNLEEVRAAISIFGALALGVELDTAQQAQTDAGLWDYKRSGLWGGHAVPAMGYTSAKAGKDFVIVTWADLVGMTDAFWTHQVQEAYAVAWPEHTGTRQFQEGIDVAAWNAAFTAITGRPGPLPAGPTPTPAPTPTPGTDPKVAADTALAAAFDKWRATR